MKTRKFKEGDLLSNGSERGRLVLAVTHDCYYFADYNFEDKSFFINPTMSAFGFPTMEKKFWKVGMIKDLKKAQEDFTEISLRHARVFDEARGITKKWKIQYDEDNAKN